MNQVIGIMIAKGTSRRLRGKNTLPFCGRPLFEWNLEKLLKLDISVHFDSDDDAMLTRAKTMGASIHKRPRELRGHDVPSIPIFQSIVKELADKPHAILNLQANSPNCSLHVLHKCLAVARYVPFNELLTIYPDQRKNGSVWGFSFDRLSNYKDPYIQEVDVWIVDDAIDIHTIADFEKAQRLCLKT